REQAEAAVLEFDLPGHPARFLARQVRVVEGTPSVHEALWWVELVHRLVGLHAAVRSPGAVSVGRVLDPRLVEVARRELRLGDRIPDRLGRCLDEHLVHLRRLGGRRGHELFSSSVVLRSASADTWRPVYLSIQRSWI